MTTYPASPKYIVYCGPRLVLNHVFEPAPGYVQHVLPEANGGAQYLRDLVQQLIADNKPAMVITRFEFVVSEFASEVSRGTIGRDDVVFRLVDDDGGVSQHQMDPTLQFLGNRWPMGILW